MKRKDSKRQGRIIIISQFYSIQIIIKCLPVCECCCYCYCYSYCLPERVSVCEQEEQYKKILLNNNNFFLMQCSNHVKGDIYTHKCMYKKHQDSQLLYLLEQNVFFFFLYFNIVAIINFYRQQFSNTHNFRENTPVLEEQIYPILYRSFVCVYMSVDMFLLLLYNSTFSFLLFHSFLQFVFVSLN